MRAARYYGKEGRYTAVIHLDGQMNAKRTTPDIRIVNDLERPECGDGQVKVEPAFVGICGTGA